MLLLYPGFARSADYEELVACTDKVTASFNGSLEKSSEGFSSQEEFLDSLKSAYYADLKKCYKKTETENIMPAYLRGAASDTEPESYRELSACLRQAGNDNNERVSVCLRDLEAYKGMGLIAYDEYASRQEACAKGETLDLYAQDVSTCYSTQRFDNIFDIPAVKESIANAALDYADFLRDPNAVVLLISCMEPLYPLFYTDSSAFSRAVADCYQKQGFEKTSRLHKTTAIINDCSQETVKSLGLNSAGEMLFGSPGERAQSYLEHCIIKRSSSVLTAASALAVPLSAGAYNVVLYFQFLLTQPLLLFARRKYKSWGRVFNACTDQPLDLSIVRLLDDKHKKVLASMVTGRRGSYLFLPKPGTYRVEVSKLGFSFPSSRGLGAGNDWYFGESLTIKKKDQVIDKHIPVDPAGVQVSARRFVWNKWKYRLSLILAFFAPVFSLVSLLFIQKFWMFFLLCLQVLFLLLFMRLAFKKHKRFGTIYNEKKKPLKGVLVSLFGKEYHKLVEYQVSDLFGRYFFPAAVGDFILRFEKKGFETREISLHLDWRSERKGSINKDLILKKNTHI